MEPNELAAVVGAAVVLLAVAGEVPGQGGRGLRLIAGLLGFLVVLIVLAT
jgi:hypothetical protein